MVGEFVVRGKKVKGPAVEGEGELDFGFVGAAGEVGGAAGEVGGHGEGGDSTMWRMSCVDWISDRLSGSCGQYIQ